MVQIIDAGNMNGRAQMNPGDMKAFNLEDFDVVLLTVNEQMRSAVQVISSSVCDSGNIMIDSAVLADSGLNPNDEVGLRKSLPRGGITEVVVSVRPLGETPMDSALLWVAEHAASIAQLVKKRPVYKGLEITWNDAEICPLKFKILDTIPEIIESETAIIDTTGSEVVFNIVPATDMGFNAILCIDVSGSMLKEDFLVQDVGNLIDYLKTEYTISRELNDFLDQFKEGESVSRISSAAAAALLYLSLKAKRGLGENVQLITFGDDVEVLEVENEQGVMSPVIECTGTMRDLNLNTLAWFLIEKSKEAKGLTAMSVALKVASEQIQHFPSDHSTRNQKPTMIIVLSDGNPNKGDEPNNIPVNPIPVAKEFLKKEGVVLYTIGLGEADDILMQKLGHDIGRGDYFRATDLLELWNFYDKLANNFSISTISTPSEEPEEISIPEHAIADNTQQGEMIKIEESLVEPVNDDGTLDDPLELVQKTPIPNLISKTPIQDKPVHVKTPDTPPAKEVGIFFMATIGPGEKQVKLSIKESVPIDEVKNTVGKVFGLIPADFHLAYGGVTLEEEKTLAEYSVKNGDTILLIPASYAGGKKRE